MKYKNIVKGEFIARPNRFIAYVLLNGEQETVHVKNTGRCRELLTEGATVYLEKSDNEQRKTKYDLVAVEKKGRLINMDSIAPNQAVYEWLQKGELIKDILKIKPEAVYKKSRFDFYIETKTEKIFIEVKGVTLEKENKVSFPDAPSERAIKHVEELIEAKKEGYKTYILFIVQMQDVKYFVPNEQTQPALKQVLQKAHKEGVSILAYDCKVQADEMVIDKPVRVRLEVGENEEQLRKIPMPLLNWYDNSHRILPWREEPTPYRVWVSEIMLQQTRVEAVKPYFERFMEALPNIESLAQAQEDVLLKLWEGLGYYNRVRNLQKAAIQIQTDYKGEMPSEFEELLKLSGIGSYTAGAVSSIAFGKKNPAVDGNVLRVVSRLCADKSDILDSKVKKQMELDLLEIMPSDRPGDFNQAMMELGAMICAPNGMPKCDLCPLHFLCKAKEENNMMDYPKKTPKKARTLEDKTILVIRDENKAVIRKRAGKGLLAGMYEFPTLEGHKTAEEVIEYLGNIPLKVIRIQKLQDSKHIFSHKEWHMIGYAVRVDELAEKPDGALDKTPENDFLLIEPMETQEKYPIPTAFSAYTNYLNIRLGKDRFENSESGVKKIL